MYKTIKTGYPVLRNIMKLRFTAVLTAILIISIFLPCHARYDRPPHYSPSLKANDVDQLISLLSSSVLKERYDAIILLGIMGGKAEKAVPELIKLLGDNAVIQEEGKICPDGPVDTIAEATVNVLSKIGDERAIAPLLELLPDADEKMKALLISALSRFNSPQMVEPLIKELEVYNSKDDTKNNDYNIKATLIITLGRLKDNRAVLPLNTALEDTDPIKILAINALSEIGDPRAIVHLIDLLTNDNHQVKTAAMTALSKFGSPAVVHLIPLLNTDDRNMRKDVMNIIETIGDEAQDQLIDACSDKSAFIRQSVAYLLGKIGDKKAVEPVISLLKDEDATVRINSVITLGRLSDLRASEPLAKMLDDADPQVRAAVIKALASTGDDNAARALIPFLKDTDTNIRIDTIYSLGAIGSKEAVLPLIDVLSDDYTSIRGHAAFALGLLGDKRAVEHLEGILTSEDSFVCRQAAGSLKQLGWVPSNLEDEISYLIILRDYEGLIKLGYAAVEVLLDTLADTKEPDTKKDIAYVLGRIKDERAVEPLIEALKDNSEDICIYAAWALGEIGDGRAVEPLIKALKPDSSLKRINNKLENYVIVALGKLKDPRAIDALLTMIKNRSCVGDAAKALGSIGEPAVDVLLPLLKDDDTKNKWDIITALSLTGSPRVIEPLLEIFNDNINNQYYMFNEKISADDFVKGLKEFRSVEALLNKLETKEWKKNKALNNAFIAALGVISDERAVEPLISFIKENVKYLEEVSLKANKDVKHVFSDRTVTANFQILVNALGKLKDPRAVDVLIELSEYYPDISVIALGEIGSPKAVDILLDYLKSNDPRLRGNAAWALGEIGNPRAVEPLISMCNDKDAYAKNMAVYALGKLGDSRAVSTLESLFNASDPIAFIPAVKSLIKLGWEPPDIDGKIKSLIVTQNWGELVQIGEPAINELIRAAKGYSPYSYQMISPAGAPVRDNYDFQRPDLEPEIQRNNHFLKYYGVIRGGSALALIKIGRPAAKEIIRRISEYKDNDTMMIEILGKIGDLRATGVLADFLEKPKENDQRKHLFSVFGEIGDPRAVEPILAAIMSDDNKYYLLDAQNALKKIGKFSAINQSAIKHLILSLTSEHKYIRENALKILSLVVPDWKESCVADFIIPVLIESLSDASPQKRYMSAETLDMLGWKPSKTSELVAYMIATLNIIELKKLGALSVLPMIEILKKGENEKTSDIILTLAYIGDVRAVEPLLEMLKNDDYYKSRYSIVSALVKLNAPNIAETLLELIKSDKTPPQLRIHMIRELVTLRDPRVTAGLSEFVNNSGLKETERIEVISELGRLGNDNMLEALINIYEKNYSREIRLSVIKALRSHHNDRVTGFLEKVVNEDDQPLAGAAVLELIKRKWNPSTQTEKIQYYMAEKKWWLIKDELNKPAIKYIIAYIGDIDSRDINYEKGVSEALKKLDAIDPDWRNRAEVTQVYYKCVTTINTMKTLSEKNGYAYANGQLGRAVKTLMIIKDKQAIKHLITVLIGNYGMDSLVMQALEEIDPDWKKSKAAKEVVATYIEKLKTERDDSLELVDYVDILSTIGGAKVVETFLSILESDDGNYSKRREKIEKLRKMPRGGSVASAVKSAFINEYENEDSSYRLKGYVINGLRKLSGKDFDADPAAWRAWWEYNKFREEWLD